MSPICWIIVIGAGAFALLLSILNAIHRVGAGSYLCDDCQFNDEISCLKRERPGALSCTSYRVRLAIAKTGAEPAADGD